ncbi:MAG: hypothetical protein ABWY12_12075 [Burkholderiales bacterium]
MIRLPRLPSFAQIVDKDGKPSLTFTRYFQSFAEQIELVINKIAELLGITEQLDAAIAMATAAAAAAQEAAENAQDAADNASAGNAASTREQALVSSGIMPRTVILATSTGDVNIAAHTRYYGDGTSVAVDAGGLSGYNPADEVYVSYVNPDRTGGPVTYEGSAVFQSQTSDRHVVGSVIVPATGAQPGEPGPAPPGG